MRTPTADLTLPHAALWVALLAPLAGCMSDSASYLVDGDNKHTITVLRNQDLFWKDTADLSLVPTRMPACQGSLRVRDVPRDAAMKLYWAPEAFAEPIYILDIGGRFYALSTERCQVQEFKEAPADPGTSVGIFKERDGRLVFEVAGAKPPSP
jgi:hypothetical protein